MKQKKYLAIIGGSKADAEKKFPWLKKAKFENAVIDIRGYYFIWEGGIWKDGIWNGGIWEGGTWEGGIWKGGYWKSGYWEGGIWKDGIWEGGIWKGGYWKGGIWENGRMWSNLKHTYLSVMFDYEKKEFKEV